MTDLIVTAAVLEESSAKLAAIKQEFDTAGDRVKEDAEVWGQENVRSAMADFVHNWGMHRTKISTAVGDLQKKVDDMTETWGQTEQTLADGLTTDVH